MKLQVVNLNSFYGPAHILFDIALQVGEGEVVALLGRNGAGKSTTFRSIVGLVGQRSGQILFEGRDVSREPTHAIVRGGLGYVPEERRIFTDLTVDENLEVGRLIGGPGGKKLPELVYEYFPRLKERRRQAAGTMSGGEQQQLAIGRALIGNPSLMILDEPSEGIQPSIVQHICEALRSFRNELGTTIIFVEQNLDMVAQYGMVAIVVALVMALASAGRFYFISVLGERVLTDLRRKVFEHLLTLDSRFFDLHRVGELTSRLNGDVATIRGAIGSSLSIMLRGVDFLASWGPVASREPISVMKQSVPAVTGT